MQKMYKVCDQRLAGGLGIAAFLLSLALLLTPFILPVCNSLIETKAGMKIPMRCHWSYQIENVIAVLGLGLTVLYFWVKNPEVRKYFGLGFIVLGLLAVFVPTDHIIGICRSPDMACRHTTPWMWGWGTLLSFDGLALMAIHHQQVQSEKRLNEAREAASRQFSGEDLSVKP